MWVWTASFSYPSKIPFLYRQLNRSCNKFDTSIKIVQFCFFISLSTILRDTYLPIFSLPILNAQRDIPCNFTDWNENQWRSYLYRIRTYVPEKVEGKKVKNDNNIEKQICKRWLWKKQSFTQFIHSQSYINNAQIASLLDIKREIVVFTSACLRSGLNTAKLSKRQIQAFIYNVVSRSN